jgi:transcriptional regulator with XRE-family HTH domain
MADSFGQFVRERIRRRDISVREYARLAGYPSAHSFVSRVLRGVDPPPLKEMDRWAAALGISPDERDRFDELAALAHSPPLIRERYEAMRDRLVAAPKGRVRKE